MATCIGLNGTIHAEGLGVPWYSRCPFGEPSRVHHGSAYTQNVPGTPASHSTAHARGVWSAQNRPRSLSFLRPQSGQLSCPSEASRQPPAGDSAGHVQPPSQTLHADRSRTAKVTPRAAPAKGPRSRNADHGGAAL